MKNAAVLLCLLLVFCLICGLLWGLQLAFGFEADTGLAVAGNKPGLALKFLAAAFVLGAAAYCLRLAPAEDAQALLWTQSARGRDQRLMRVSGAFLMGIGGVAALADFMGNIRISVLISALLAFFAAFAVFKLTIASGRRGNFQSEHLFLSLVPLYWSCYFFMMTYKEEAANATMDAYFYRLLAAMCIMLGFYRFCACFYRKPGVRLMTFFSLNAVFFTAMTCFGQIFAGLAYKAPLRGALADYIGMAGASLVLLANVLVVIKTLPGNAFQRRTGLWGGMGGKRRNPREKPFRL